ncbi:hypothetical protein [Streptomyces sp. NPDC017941]|uniref:hypothetical protein n=1 Tax=unclassified Streptomyces TaxID=2593676 RepID=UPI0037B7A38D
MWAPLITTALAVLGTLAGATVSGRAQERAAAQVVRVQTDEDLRRDRTEAVIELACAASDHRRALWRRGDAVLKDASTQRTESLREESHLTRGALNRPLIALRVLIEDQDVRAAADHMVTLTHAIRDAYATARALTAAREAAMVAHDQFVDAAARYLTPAAPTAHPRPTSEETAR